MRFVKEETVKMKKLISLLILVLLLSGCSDAKETVETQTANDVSSTDSLDDNFYRIVKLDVYENRENYYTSFGNTSDFQTIGRELQALSTEYFSTSDYYLSEGQILGYSQIQELTRRSDDPDKYPYTIQSQKGTSIGGVNDPVMVSTVYEQDYYQKSGDDYSLEGMALAIVIDPREADASTRLKTNMDESLIVDFGRESVSKLYTYIEHLSKEDDYKDLKDIPIFITVYYATNTNESDIDGRYILKSYCNGSVGEIESLDYHTYLFTSSDASTYDEQTASQFEIFKSNMKKAGVEAVGVVGYGKYQDGELQSLKINVNTNVKTYTELLYLVETAADEANSQFGNDYPITILVYSQDQLEAIIIKEKGEDAKSHLLN